MRRFVVEGYFGAADIDDAFRRLSAHFYALAHDDHVKPSDGPEPPYSLDVRPAEEPDGAPEGTP